ncbi:hypothetical protein [Actinophytocola sp.]|uniref:hypothetical protein n=1 Tax=Actinophytocola sp. TaxID=1872138 RepID=UPI00389B1DCC
MRRILPVLAALIGFSGVFVGAGAAAADTPDRRVTRAAQECGGWRSLYSEGRWTYSETRLCLRTDGQYVAPVLQWRECQYYWGAAWYYANDKYPCRLDLDFAVSRNGHTIASGIADDQGGKEGEVIGKAGFCHGGGDYTLTADFVQDGPYWYNWEIHSGQKVFDFILPCQ